MKRILLPLILFFLAVSYVLAIIIGQTSGGVVYEQASTPDPNQGAPALNVEYWMLMAAMANVFIAALAVFILFRTLIVTHGMLDKAEETVKVTRHMGQAQTRAYISVEAVTAKYLSWSLRFHVTVVNSGATPARNCVIKIKRASAQHWKASEPKASEPMELLIQDDNKCVVVGDIGAGQKREASYDCRFIKKHIDAKNKAYLNCSEGNSPLTVEIEAIAGFVDVFGEEILEPFIFTGRIDTQNTQVTLRAEVDTRLGLFDSQ